MNGAGVFFYSKHWGSNCALGMVEFTRGMSKQATSPPTALGQWRPASSLRTRQSGGLHDTTSGNLEGLNSNF